MVLQYLRALMQGRLVCRGADERTKAAERLKHDAAQLRELFLGLVRAHRASRRVELSVIRWWPRTGAILIPTCPGPGGKRSVCAGAARSAGVAEPPRSHTAWPRGGRPTPKISGCEVGRLEWWEEDPGVRRYLGGEGQN